MFYYFIYLAKGIRMRPKVRSTLMGNTFKTYVFFESKTNGTFVQTDFKTFVLSQSSAWLGFIQPYVYYKHITKCTKNCTRCLSVLLLKHNFFKKCTNGFIWLCWGLTSQSTIFQSCRDGAIASWVINQYFRGVKCLAQGHNTAAVGLTNGFKPHKFFSFEWCQNHWEIMERNWGK